MDMNVYRERIDEYKDRIPEIRERIDEWREELPEPEVIETAAGAAMFGLGAVAAVWTSLSGRRGMWAWFLPAVLLTGGASLLIAGALQIREERIEVAEETVRAELGRLDPIARAKVMKDIAEEQLSVLARKSDAEA